MDQPCYKCGQRVEEGVPFCPHCSAPQIRVRIAEPPAPPVLATEPSSAISGSEAAAVVFPMGWSAALRPCMLAAVIASILMYSGLYPFIAMIAVGFLAVVFYRQRWPGSAIKPAAGVRLGALSGLLGFAISSLFQVILVIFLHKGAEVRDQLMKVIDQAATRTTDPQAIAMLQRFKSGDGLEILMIFIVIFLLLTSILLGVLGGALGGALLGRNNRS
jgi:hypothetical protein